MMRASFHASAMGCNLYEYYFVSGPPSGLCHRSHISPTFRRVAAAPRPAGDSLPEMIVEGAWHWEAVLQPSADTCLPRALELLCRHKSLLLHWPPRGFQTRGFRQGVFRMIRPFMTIVLSLATSASLLLSDTASADKMRPGYKSYQNAHGLNANTACRRPHFNICQGCNVVIPMRVAQDRGCGFNFQSLGPFVGQDVV